tara:strand:- start:13455 stop:13865 length:411 start_codon:yes stop_codon:yes gene_type:complete
VLAPGRQAQFHGSKTGGRPGHKLISPGLFPGLFPGLRSDLVSPSPSRAAPSIPGGWQRQQAALAYASLGSSRLSALGFFPPGLVEAAGIEPAFPGRPVWALAGSDHVAPDNPSAPLGLCWPLWPRPVAGLTGALAV